MLGEVTSRPALSATVGANLQRRTDTFATG